MSEEKSNPWTPLFDRFNRVVQSETDTLLKHIKETQVNLTNECDSLQKEIELLRKEKEEMTKLQKQYEQIVTLNIGGQLFSTTKQTLTKEQCLFTKMFSGLYDFHEYQGATFIDRDPTYFRFILNYMRTNAFIEPKTDQERTEILLEAEFYQIPSLIDKLKGQTKTIESKNIVEKLFFDPQLHHPSVTVSNGGLTANHSGGCTQFLYVKVANNVLWTSGKHYWEITMNESRRCNASMGIATSAWNTNKRLGDDCYSWTLRLYGKHTAWEHHGTRHNGSSSSYYDTFTDGMRIGAFLDLDAGNLEYVVNGVRQGIAFNNLRGQTVSPVFELCHQTTFQMNHNATAPVI